MCISVCYVKATSCILQNNSAFVLLCLVCGHAARRCRLSGTEYCADVYSAQTSLHSELGHCEEALHYMKLNLMVSRLHTDAYGHSILNMACQYIVLWRQTGGL